MDGKGALSLADLQKALQSIGGEILGYVDKDGVEHDIAKLIEEENGRSTEEKEAAV